MKVYPSLHLLAFFFFLFLSVGSSHASAPEAMTSTPTNTMSSKPTAYNFSFESIDGKAMPLEIYRGKVLLIVNTASLCGFTPQYADLETLYERYKEQGLVIIGVPSDNFGNQEPGSNADIVRLTTEKFHVTFPLTAKTNVVGNDRHPFYTWASNQDSVNLITQTPRWNFHKFLISRKGELIDGFVSPTKPLDKGLTDAIEKALKEKTS